MGPLAKQRRSLPVFSFREQLLETIGREQVVVVEGETGSGKTTQVPHFVLEDAAARGKPCNIVVAQPRRISAMSVAERIAAERGEDIGGTVGYKIRLESKAKANTRLLFCTTGILLKRLEEDPDLENVTHVFVDEVHERTIESDFLLMVLRDLLKRRNGHIEEEQSEGSLQAAAGRHGRSSLNFEPAARRNCVPIPGSPQSGPEENEPRARKKINKP